MCILTLFISLMFKCYFLDIQSQPVWWHYLYVTVPDILEYNKSALMFIEGGANTDRQVYM